MGGAFYKGNFLYDLKLLNGAHSCLRQLLATESPFKMKKNAFYCISKVLFVLKILKFLSWLPGYVAKWLE